MKDEIDYYVIVVRDAKDRPWQAYVKPDGQPYQYADIHKAIGVMKCVFYTKCLSNDANVQLKSHWLAGLQPG